MAARTEWITANFTAFKRVPKPGHRNSTISSTSILLSFQRCTFIEKNNVYMRELATENGVRNVDFHSFECHARSVSHVSAIIIGMHVGG